MYELDLKGCDVYTKDLASLLQLLSVSGQSGLLRLEPLEPARDREPWHAHFILSAGEIVTCQVLSKVDGRELISGSVAIQRLTQLGPLSWSLEEMPATRNQPRVFPSAVDNPPYYYGAGSPPVSPRGQEPNGSGPPVFPYAREQSTDGRSPFEQMKQPTVLIPRRTASGEYATVNSSWPRDHRLVFALVDGHRTLEEIAALIHKAPDTVARVLDDLQSIGVIERHSNSL